MRSTFKFGVCCPIFDADFVKFASAVKKRFFMEVDLKDAIQIDPYSFELIMDAESKECIENAVKLIALTMIPCFNVIALEKI